MNRAWAEGHARAWIDNWSTRDIEAVLAHFSDHALDRIVRAMEVMRVGPAGLEQEAEAVYGAAAP